MLDIKNILIESIFIGFGLFVLLATFLLLIKNDKMKRILATLMQSAIFLARLAGILYGLYWIFQITMTYNSEYSILNRLDGPYWWSVWFMVILLPILSQLYWIKIFRTHILLRVLVAAAILYVALIISDNFVMMTVSLHRDFTEAPLYLPHAFALLKNIAFFFILLLILFQFQKKKYTPKIENHD